VSDGNDSGGGVMVAPRRNALVMLAGKAGWDLADQILSTLTNAVLSILVAQQVDKFAAGAFGVAFLLFSLGIAIERALTGQVLTIRHSAAEDHEWSGISARALGTVATLAVPAGAVMVIAGVLLGGVLRWPLIAVGVTLAPLLMQDTIRSIFFAQSRAQFAALNDAVWGVVQFTVMGVLIVGGWASAGSLTFAWGVSSAVCVVVGAVQLRAVPSLRATRGWVREHGDLLGYLLPETLITSGGDKAAYLAVGSIVNVAAVGAVNYARQLLSPLLIITQAAASFAMPEISRRVHLAPRVRWLIGVGMAAAMGLTALIYLGAVLLVPDSLGTWLFGQTWSGARSVLLPMGLFSVSANICFGPFMVIAAMGHAKRTFRITLLQTALMLTLMPLGAVLNGTEGAAWGLFIGKAIEIPFWFATLRTAARLGPVATRDAEAPAGEDGVGGVEPGLA
jgi:O-antigen/teichoic acid export membrane protein